MPKESKSKKKLEKVIESQILKIIAFLFVVMITFLIAGYIFKQMNQFEYQGLTFTKERFGQIPVYHYYFYGETISGDIYKYNLYLRTDPRLNNIGVEGSEVYLNTRNVYLTLNTDYLNECDDNALAIGDLTLFLKDNQMNVTGANMDYTEAIMNGQKYATCETESNNFVIEIFKGDETKINVKNKCAQISVGPQCDILNATEKFKTQALIDARQRELDKKGALGPN